MTKVVNLRKTPYEVYIGRGSIWGNPYSHREGTMATFVVKDRETAIQKYEEYIRNRPELMNQLYTLKGKVLGCYCKPLPCHGDILIKLIKETENK